MIDYKVDGREFNISYRELKQLHNELSCISVDEFMDRLPEAIHLACIISWFKELPTQQVLSDYGIIHQLAHLMHIPDEPQISKEEIFEQFKKDLKLI